MVEAVLEHRLAAPGEAADGAEVCNVAGRGQCGWFNASDLTAGSGQATEEKLLREEADRLAKQLEVINRRLEEFGK